MHADTQNTVAQHTHSLARTLHTFCLTPPSTVPTDMPRTRFVRTKSLLQIWASSVTRATRRRRALSGEVQNVGSSFDYFLCAVEHDIWRVCGGYRGDGGAVYVMTHTHCFVPPRCTRAHPYTHSCCAEVPRTRMASGQALPPPSTLPPTACQRA